MTETSTYFYEAFDLACFSFILPKEIDIKKMPKNDKDMAQSKSEVKRNKLALQKLGEVLVDLSNEQLKKLTIADNLREAIKEAKSFKSVGAKRRQLQYISKLMRDIDYKEIVDLFSTVELKTKNAKMAMIQITTALQKME